MADAKITDLTAQTGAGTATGDQLVIVDVSDTSMAASGTDKKITANELSLAVSTLLNLAGTYQALDSELTALASVTSAADKVPYFTGSGAAAVASYTSAARTFDALASLLTQQQYLTTQTINAQTGTTYTLAAGDVSKLVTLSNAGAITLTVPQDSDVTWSVGDWVEGFQLGAGQVTVAAGTGATLRATPGAKSRAQYSRFFLQKISANTWALSGDISA